MPNPATPAPSSPGAAELPSNTKLAKYGGRPPRSPEFLRAFADEYCRGARVTALAEKHGVGRDTAYRWLHLAGLSGMRNGRAPRSPEFLRAIRESFERGVSPDDIAREHGVTLPSAYRWLKHAGVSPARKRKAYFFSRTPHRRPTRILAIACDLLRASHLSCTEIAARNRCTRQYVDQVKVSLLALGMAPGRWVELATVVDGGIIAAQPVPALSDSVTRSA